MDDEEEALGSDLDLDLGDSEANEGVDWQSSALGFIAWFQHGLLNPCCMIGLLTLGPEESKSCPHTCDQTHPGSCWCVSTEGGPF